ncbi:COPS7B isoform 13 [Pan troglodytes]|uniref:COP9 signalosome subunit 7B n=6 Tax=Homininae TaxID=207598 RepID=J3KQ41_HUMAN|nr:COP9 signalosome complex subunit 7b isoform f [Homo sapiens]XP_006712756.1 COP9 signalosome complex subunit 7b isoform X1 [Homo sapiens]XP_016806188.1 COP9 signalosome complex subunit 7b isoform X1 [Pan troglodytes]XP_032609748.1 COP9 signalosome complex subunit 7b isoform X1 [Hylobates moloch]XP_032609750.1 COP9 signalosome complex subunit 7b isoform X1 [Hylobates moloch]XP_054199372.1 COP9 signalosome complex subunit 7b isoform X1 [Homo sapiens]XP_054535491.1 COP9 signalosome complex sub|eukprot:NP_001295310.1 COP9 signalosome complex subunit 7b isoform f [Homo sapiens]
MAGEQKPSSNLLEQFILLAKGTSGSALTALISQVLEAPGVYVFGELLELANVQELAEGANAAYLQLLNLFAYGTYPDYIANKESLPELSTAQQNKLKHLTIVSLASRMKCIPYSVLLKDLEMRNLRELEDLIIEAVYTDIIQGKLDQRNQLLEVDFCIGRDIRKKDINNIVKTLHEWCDGCEAVLLGIEQQVLRANQYKENHNRTQQQVEAEIACFQREKRDVPLLNLITTAFFWLPTSRRHSKPPHPPRLRRWSSSWLNGSVPLTLSRGSPPRRCPK